MLGGRFPADNSIKKTSIEGHRWYAEHPCLKHSYIIPAPRQIECDRHWNITGTILLLVVRYNVLDPHLVARLRMLARGAREVSLEKRFLNGQSIPEACGVTIVRSTCGTVGWEGSARWPGVCSVVAQGEGRSSNTPLISEEMLEPPHIRWNACCYTCKRSIHTGDGHARRSLSAVLAADIGHCWSLVKTYRSLSIAYRPRFWIALPIVHSWRGMVGLTTAQYGLVSRVLHSP